MDRLAQAGELRIDTSKNGEGRTVPYGEVPELKTAIDAQWKVHQALASKDTINPGCFRGAARTAFASFVGMILSIQGIAAKRCEKSRETL
jgi:hypothetical protein